MFQLKYKIQFRFLSCFSILFIYFFKYGFISKIFIIIFVLMLTSFFFFFSKIMENDDLNLGCTHSPKKKKISIDLRHFCFPQYLCHIYKQKDATNFL